MTDFSKIVDELRETAGEILANAAVVQGKPFANAAAVLFEVSNLVTLVCQLVECMPDDADCAKTAQDLRSSIEHGVLLGLPVDQWDAVKKLVQQLVDRQAAIHARIAAGEFTERKYQPCYQCIGTGKNIIHGTSCVECHGTGRAGGSK